MRGISINAACYHIVAANSHLHGCTYQHASLCVMPILAFSTFALPCIGVVFIANVKCKTSA